MSLEDGVFTSAATASSFEALSSSAAAASKDAAKLAALNELSEVQVKFFTRNPNLPSVPDTFLNVPVKLARYGLSEIVNALTETSPPRPFDFLIKGHFLRSDLLRYLQKIGSGAEGCLELEYVEAAPEPESNPSRPHPDWISSIDARGARGQHIVTGCFDSVVRVYDGKKASAPAIALGVGHASAIKSVSVFRRRPTGVKEEDASLQIATGSKDRSVRVWKFTPGQSSLRCIAQGIGHTDSVECVATAAGAETFCSGGWDNQIAVWDITNADTKNTTEESTPAQKKRKTDASSSSSSAAAIPSHMPLRFLPGHTAAVSTLVYPHPSAVYSGSYDHSLKQWDVEAGTCTNTWFGRQVVTSIDFNLERNVLGSGHHDKIIRIWDPRKEETESMKLSFKSHKGWVSCVKFNPLNAYQLASASYDNTVKLWDLRSSLPLFTMAVHKDKVMSLDWADGEHLWSGGADNQLQTHTIKQVV